MSKLSQGPKGLPSHTEQLLCKIAEEMLIQTGNNCHGRRGGKCICINGMGWMGGPEHYPPEVLCHPQRLSGYFKVGPPRPLVFVLDRLLSHAYCAPIAVFFAFHAAHLHQRTDSGGDERQRGRKK